MLVGTLFVILLFAVALMLVITFTSLDLSDCILASFLFCLIAGVVPVAAIISGAESRRLMAECRQDGHKEYECVAMLRSRNSVVPVPVIVGR